jgi:hypothetical protein
LVAELPEPEPDGSVRKLREPAKRERCNSRAKSSLVIEEWSLD